MQERATKPHWSAYVTMASAIVAVLILGGCLFAMVKLGDLARFQQEAKLSEISSWLKYQSTSTFGARTVSNSCSANNNEVTCAFTNESTSAVSTCIKAQLTNLKNQNMTVDTMPICSGRLVPFETRNVSTHWKGANAASICSRQTSYGETLDWAKCSFTVDEYQPRSIVVATP